MRFKIDYDDTGGTFTCGWRVYAHDEGYTGGEVVTIDEVQKLEENLERVGKALRVLINFARGDGGDGFMSEDELVNGDPPEVEAAIDAYNDIPQEIRQAWVKKGE